MINNAIVAAFIACAAYSPYGVSNGRTSTYIYEGQHKAECEKIQAEYQREVEAEQPAKRNAEDAANDKAIKAGIAAIEGK